MYTNQQNPSSPSAPLNPSMQQWPYSPATLGASTARSPVSSPSDHSTLHSPDSFRPVSMPLVDAGPASVNEQGNEASRVAVRPPPAYSTLNRTDSISTISKVEIGDAEPQIERASRSRPRQTAEAAEHGYGPFELGTAS